MSGHSRALSRAHDIVTVPIQTLPRGLPRSATHAKPSGRRYTDPTLPVAVFFLAVAVVLVLLRAPWVPASVFCCSSRTTPTLISLSLQQDLRAREPVISALISIS